MSQSTMKEPGTRSVSWAKHVPWAKVAPVAVLSLLAGVLVVSMIARHRPAALSQTPTAAPTITGGTAGAAPAPTATVPAADDAIAVGFVPGSIDGTIRRGTPVTFLGPVEWVSGVKHCYVETSYTDEGGNPKMARFWGKCEAFGIDAPDPTPAPTSPPPNFTGDSAGGGQVQNTPGGSWTPPPYENTPAILATEAPADARQMAPSQNNPQGCVASGGGGRCNAPSIPEMANGNWPVIRWPATPEGSQP